jgi:hypothetical protein
MTPAEIFFEFFTNELFDKIAIQTNLYFKQENEKKKSSIFHKWVDVDSNVIKAFSGILLLMGINYRDSIDDHWSTNFLMRSIISELISRERFYLIWSYFHLEDNSKINAKIDKVTNFIEYLEVRWNLIFTPGSSLVLDETMMPFQGKSQFLQYAPQKPCKWGIKAFSVADCKTRYIVKFWPFTKTDEKVSNVYVKKRIDYISNSDRVLFMDSYFTDLSMFEYALEKNVDCIGMANKKRKFLPSQLKNRTSSDSSIKYYQRKNIFLINCQDKKQLNILSTIKNNEEMPTEYYNKKKKIFSNKKKPVILVDYTYKMRGVDINNQLTYAYLFDNRVYKWWKVVFLYSLQLSITNAYILYSTYTTGKLDDKKFILSIIDSLLHFHSFLYKKQITLDLQIFYDNNTCIKICRNCKINGKSTKTKSVCKTCKLSICSACRYDHLIKDHSDKIYNI